MQGLSSILSLFRKEFNKSTYLSYDIRITLESHFWRQNVIILSLCMQRCYGRHNYSRKSVNHKCFIDFIAVISLPDKK